MPRVAIFADIIKIVSQKKDLKRIRKYVSKCNLYLCFLIQQNLLIFGEKILMSVELMGCAT